MALSTVENLLELTNVRRSFGTVEAVRSMNLAVQQGEFVSLLGPSGCGKTTTLRLIAGFEVPDDGIIRFETRTLADKNTFVPPKDRRVGMVFQDYALFPHLNVAQNVGFGLQSDPRQKAQRISEMFELVGLQGFDQRMPHELSGGQQQRVALARALAPAPKMLLLDEPFSSLDAALRTQVRSEMRSILRQAGVTCIFVTHAQDEALSLSDRVAVMFDGSIAQIAAPEDLYESPATAQVAGFVGEANLIAGEAYGDYAESVLGRLPLREPRVGRCTLLIRPEALQFSEAIAEASAGVSARITWNEYYGHERRVGLVTPDGTRLVARIDAAVRAPIGSSVVIDIRKPVKAYFD